MLKVFFLLVLVGFCFPAFCWGQKEGELTMEKVALFPSDYSGKYVRFNGVQISGLEKDPMKSDGADVFTLDVKSKGGKFFGSGLRQYKDLNVVLDSKLARKLSDYFDKHPHKDVAFVVNLTGTIKLLKDDVGDEWKLFVLSSIEFLGYDRKVLETLQ